MTTSKEFGKIFRDAREKQKISIENVNLRSRIHSGVIKDIENGIYERLAETYTKSFIKKYAVFLGLDTEDILRKYESLHRKIPERGFLQQEDVGEKVIKQKIEDVKKVRIMAGRETKFLALVAVALSAFFVIFAVLVGRTRTRPGQIGEVFNPAQKESSVQPGPEMKIPDNAPLVLTLGARGKTWVQVFEGGRKIFVGTLKKGDAKTFESQGALTVWTGKGENLYFTVNGHRIGKVADGVVKNIQVSKKGIRKGNKWVTRFD